jgi:cytoskeletal protein CcmA (bactofilin family)
MFAKKKQPPIRTLIGEGTRIEGRLLYSDGLRIDGEVIGDVVAEGEVRSIVVISEKARIVGKVKGAHVIVNGAVEGPVESSELLELQPKARITGDVRYQALEMHQGASIQGKLHPLSLAEASAYEPVNSSLKLATSNG